MNPIIKIKNLQKKFKVKQKSGFLRDLFAPKFSEVFAVKDISFEVKAGESVAFLGPNGAGKTTTTKMMTGLIYPSAGEISVMGFTPFERKKEFLMNIGLVMGNKAGLNWDLTARQSFNLQKQIYRIPNEKYEERIKSLTTLLEVEDFLDRQVRKLSLGERMKMELIGAILHNPKILFLDEPTIGLDINAKQKVREFLREIQKESNITIILTSHDMDDVEKVCDRVIVINYGEKVYDGSLNELNQKYQQFKYIKLSFDKKPEVENFGVEAVEESENSYTFKVKKQDVSFFVSKATSKYDLADLEIISTPLEDIIGDLFRVS